MKKLMTICFLVKKEGLKSFVCLAEKKRGFRTGKINGYGGKLEDGESLEECAIRETYEEAGVKVTKIEKSGEIKFYDPGLTHECHVYIIRTWKGDIVETEEMKPRWYLFEDIPFEKMGQADLLWIPHILQGKYVKAEFHYDENNTMYQNKVDIIDAFYPSV